MAFQFCAVGVGNALNNKEASDFTEIFLAFCMFISGLLAFHIFKNKELYNGNKGSDKRTITKVRVDLKYYFKSYFINQKIGLEFCFIKLKKRIFQIIKNENKILKGKKYAVK